MRILLTGTSGQLGYELRRSLQCLGEVVALSRSDMDLSDLQQVRAAVRHVKPSLIINPAAYTGVDKAEHEQSLAMAVNADAPAAMAEEAHALGAAMIHYSTDYVFNGSKAAPYTEEDATGPLGMYGQSKLRGEQAVRESGIDPIVLRTSWVYGMRGKNFMTTVMRLAAERDELRIVADQHGAPTWCRTIAQATAHILAQAVAAGDWRAWWQEKGGLYHLSAGGQTSWFGFTQAILTQAGQGKAVRVTPLTTREYPTAAVRPQYSVLASDKLERTFRLSLPQWDQALACCLGRD